MRNALKPCPFCGSTNVDAGYYYVICANCLAQGSFVNFDDPEYQRWIEQHPGKTLANMNNRFMQRQIKKVSDAWNVPERL